MKQRWRFKKDSLFRFSFVTLLIFLLLSQSESGKIIQRSLSDAYLNVTVFVAFTLCLIYGIEKLFQFDIGQFNLKNPHLQVYISSFLGGLPGCGGAIVVLTQFTHRQVSFGSVIAALTATMGDAAFLLLATEPQTGLLVMLLSFLTGSLTGVLTDWIHGKDFLRPRLSKNPPITQDSLNQKNSKPSLNFFQKSGKFLWFLVLVPGTFISFSQAFRIDLSPLLSTFFPILEGVAPVESTLGLIGALITLLLWTLHSKNTALPFSLQNKESENQRRHPFMLRIVQETVPITTAVILAFLLYDLSIFAFNIDLKKVFTLSGWLLPLMGILVGFIPGCGPQILVTTLYINGYLPLSVQIANAISNDGDALFPAIAKSPKAAVLATLYSAVPAVILGYAFWFWWDHS